MARPRSDIAEEICTHLGRGLDIQPTIEQRILLIEGTKPFVEWKAWAKAPKMAAKCRTDLAALRPMLDFTGRVGLAEPVNLNNLDRALWCIENMGTSDPRSGSMQYICAVYARGLILEFSKTPARGGPESPFYWIADLLHEAITGKRNKMGLKRACDALLKSERAETELPAKKQRRV